MCSRKTSRSRWFPPKSKHPRRGSERSDGRCGLCSPRPPSVPSPTCWFSCTQAVGLVSVHNYLFTHCPSPPRIIGSTPPSFRSWEAPGWRKVGPPSCFKKLNTTWPSETILYLSPTSWSWQRIFFRGTTHVLMPIIGLYQSRAPFRKWESGKTYVFVVGGDLHAILFYQYRPPSPHWRHFISLLIWLSSTQAPGRSNAKKTTPVLSRRALSSILHRVSDYWFSLSRPIHQGAFVHWTKTVIIKARILIHPLYCY